MGTCSCKLSFIFDNGLSDRSFATFLPTIWNGLSVNLPSMAQLGESLNNTGTPAVDAFERAS